MSFFLERILANFATINYFMLLIILIVLISLLSGIFIYFLFAPILLEIDTHIHLYRFSIVPIFRIWWVFDDVFGHFEMSFMDFKMILKKDENTNAKKIVKTKKIRRKKSGFTISFSKIFAVFKSFKVKKWLVNIDTGDMALNGKLFPVMYLVSVMTDRKTQINFVGNNEAVITIENTCFRMIMAFLQ